MRTVLFACLLACTSAHEEPEPQPQHLASDTYFSGIVPPYATPDDCVAANPDNVRICTYEIALCSSGKAGIRTNDVIQEGTYEAVDTKVIVTLLDGSTFQLDFESGQAVDAPLTNWVFDNESLYQTFEWDVVDCPHPTN